jgi:hypothetical protein
MSGKDFILIAETIRLLPSFETYQQDGKLYPTDVVNFSAREMKPSPPALSFVPLLVPLPTAFDRLVATRYFV